MVESGEVRGDEARDNARMVVEQIDRMTRIIRQLLDFARRRGPQKSSTDLRQLLEQTVGMTQALAAKRKVSLRLAVGEEPAGAAVDPAQLQQVLTNLIMNGIQAMPGGGALTVGLVRTRAHAPAEQDGAEASWYRVWVADEGVGIAPENVAHVFEPFFTTKGVGEGTGLGLSVAYGIVQEHGGWMDVQSELGRGSCFSVYLRDDAGAGAA
jgi:signal transduction histidine kinase